MVKYYLDIAENMWDSGLPADLEKKLSEINKLCEKEGGVLASRQTIAFIIQDYKDKKNE